MKITSFLAVAVFVVGSSIAMAPASYAQVSDAAAERRAERVAERRAERVANRVDERRAARRGAASVPELDASAAPIGLALIGGLAGIALERRRRKKSS